VINGSTTWSNAPTNPLGGNFRLADHTPGSAELVRLMDATAVPCGQSVVTACRSALLRLLPQPFPLVLGRQTATHLHLRRDGDRVRPGQPKLADERDAARAMLTRQSANRPTPGTAIVTDKGPVRRGH
jgi:hypothetical protein